MTYLDLQLNQRVWLKIKSLWQGLEAWPDFISVMQQALSPGSAVDSSNLAELPETVQLPGLCCQAAGGHLSLADDVAAAWFLFYLAAHIMDNVEDGDPPEPWWEPGGPPVAMSAATGLFFSASKALSALWNAGIDPQAAQEVSAHFHDSFLEMSAGQYRDLLLLEKNLEQYWAITLGKSGKFFSLACLSGARLATPDSQVVAAYGRYGKHLGVLIQMLDDLEIFHAIHKQPDALLPAETTRSLPVIFARSVLPAQSWPELTQALEAGQANRAAAEKATALVEASGAAMYMAAEMERHRQLSLQALSEAQPLEPARSALIGFVEKLVRAGAQ